MRIIFIMLFLSACASPQYIEPIKPPVQTHKKVELDIHIEDDFSRFGDNVAAAWLCRDGGRCTLFLPRIKSQFDSYGWCTWGYMLGRSVFGQMNKDYGIECNEYKK